MRDAGWAFLEDASAQGAVHGELGRHLAALATSVGMLNRSEVARNRVIRFGATWGVAR